MHFIALVFILPGLVAGYFFFLRPILRAVPALKTFYAEADTFWQKAWAVCGKSVTIAWGYALACLGVLLQYLDPVASALGDPALKDQIAGTLKSKPEVLGYFAICVSVITIAARLRSIGRGA